MSTRSLPRPILGNAEGGGREGVGKGKRREEGKEKRIEEATEVRKSMERG